MCGSGEKHYKEHKSTMTLVQVIFINSSLLVQPKGTIICQPKSTEIISDPNIYSLEISLSYKIQQVDLLQAQPNAFSDWLLSATAGPYSRELKLWQIFPALPCSPDSSLRLCNYLIPISDEIKHLKALGMSRASIKLQQATSKGTIQETTFNKTNHKMQPETIIREN